MAVAEGRARPTGRRAGTVLRRGLGLRGAGRPRAIPADPRPGDPIDGLDDDGQLAAAVEGVTVLHAGTRRDGPGGPFVTAGGRVLGVTARGPDPRRGPAPRLRGGRADRLGRDALPPRHRRARRLAMSPGAGPGGARR